MSIVTSTDTVNAFKDKNLPKEYDYLRKKSTFAPLKKISIHCHGKTQTNYKKR